MIEELTVKPSWCSFRDHSPGFAEVEISHTDGSARQGIRIVANSGKPILGHWHWGNFAIDLEGLDIGRTDKPILLDHEPGSIVGYTSKIGVEAEGLIVEGYLLTGDDPAFAVGNRVKLLAEQGYPWQASVYVPPEEVEIVPDGVTILVNGHSLTGPGHVFRRSTLREVTVTSMGADESTDAELFGQGRRESIVTKTHETPVPAAGEAKEVPSTLAEAADTATVVKAAIAEERHRVAKLTACADARQRSMLAELIESGASLADGLEQILLDQRSDRAERLSEMVDEAPEYVGTSEVVEGDDDDDEEEQTDAEAAEFRAKCRAAFKTSGKLRAEFPTFDSYLGFCQIDGTIYEGNN